MRIADRRRCLIAVTGLALAAQTGVAQRPVIATHPTCTGCQVSLTHLATLRPPANGGLFSPHTRVARAETGYLFVINPDQPGEIEFYDSTGAHRATSGRRGKGPGEYEAIRALWLDGVDTVIVHDPILRRLTYLGPSLNVARIVPLPFSVRHMLLLPGGDYLINASISARGASGHPLHIVNARGKVLHSFGADDDERRRDLPALAARPLTMGPEGIWAAQTAQYVFDVFNLRGRRERRVERRADWFTPWTAPKPDTPDSPPNPELSWILHDQRGHVWTQTYVAADGWSQQLVPARTGSGRSSAWEIDRWDAYYWTVLEVFDASSGQLLATHRTPRTLLGFADASHVVSYRELEDGKGRLDVWRFSLRP